jgi:hypothetical protein
MPIAPRPNLGRPARLARAAFFAGLAAAATGCASTGGRRPADAPDDGPPDELATAGVSTAVPERPRSTAAQFADADPSALTDFHDILVGYGDWIEDPEFGTVWAPRESIVGPSFAPYLTDGRWGLNEAEAHVWISDHDETFGWVVFRYGRWAWTSKERWVWVPGRTYAPAWVVWRVGAPGEPFVGWGPAPPTFVWRDGVAVPIEPAVPPLVACAAGDLFARDLEDRVLSSDQAAAVVPALVDFDARSPDGFARPRRFMATAVGLPAGGPSLSSGHVPVGAWPAERHSRAGTPNSRYATPAAMGRGDPPRGSFVAVASAAPGARLRTFAAGGALVHSHARVQRSAYLFVPTYGGGAGRARESTATEDTAVAPTSERLVPIVFPRSRDPRGRGAPR